MKKRVSSIWFDPQGSSFMMDFKYLKDHGAILRRQDTPPLSMDELADITLDLFDVRLNNIFKLATEGLDSLTRADIKESVRPHLLKILNQADSFLKMNRNDRQKVKDEIAPYEMRPFAFNAKDMQGSIRQFMGQWDNEPYGLRGSEHATTLVGYNSNEGTFIIRDSDYTPDSRYIRINPDSVFKNIDSYYKIRPIVK